MRVAHDFLIIQGALPFGNVRLSAVHAGPETETLPVIEIKPTLQHTTTIATLRAFQFDSSLYGVGPSASDALGFADFPRATTLRATPVKVIYGPSPPKYVGGRREIRTPDDGFADRRLRPLGYPASNLLF